ncbi:response regulator [Leptolyngbya sp. Heron Island J]|uniref:response regulator n=1 Tax=Leptolyngbya sp. Heron Island J TaxID=1385935 RepID=UPI00040CCA29|nr:response regulator [Leptolyngbya sp. Heron Island J]
MKFLLVEDDNQFAEALVEVLADHRYLVDRATNGEMGREMAKAFPYDLLLLDWMLPKIDGIKVCQELRATGNGTPIILMTARDTGTDKVAGLDAGADDYLVKPFGFEELLARIRALLRRSEGNASPILQWGELQLDPRSAEVSYRHVPIALTRKEYLLLELFLRNPSRIFSLDDLLDKIWSFEKAPHVNAVRTQVKGLRKKCKQAGLNNVIETVYGLGYRLAAANLTKQLKQHTNHQTMAASSRVDSQLDLTALWQSVEEIYTQRVTNLANTLHELQPGAFNETVRKQLVADAHALKGSLSSFGFSTVLTPFQEIENILLGNSRLEARHLTQLRLLIATVKEALKAPETLPETASELAKLAAKDTSSSATLLIVDDDPEMLNLLKTLLQPWGFRLQLLDKPQYFLETLDQVMPDLIILDVDMPHVSGFDLCQILRNDLRWRELPILLLSAHTEAETIQQVFSVGGDDYIRKPIVAPELVMRVFNWLERASTQKLRENIDSLTKLANRQKSIQDLSRLLRLAHRQKQTFCFAVIKLDNFQHIKDEYGQELSNLILQRLGESLGREFREEDVVARWGEEEFVVGLYGVNLKTGTQRLLQLLQTCKHEQFTSDHHRIQMTLSVGVAVFPQDAMDLQGLYQVASEVLLPG